MAALELTSSRFCDAFVDFRSFLNAMIFLKVLSEAHWFRRSEIAIAVGFWWP